MARPPELDARVVFKTFTEVLICGGKAGVTGRCVRAVTVTAVCSKWRRRRRRRRRGAREGVSALHFSINSVPTLPPRGTTGQRGGVCLALSGPSHKF